MKENSETYANVTLDYERCCVTLKVVWELYEFALNTKNLMSCE